MTSNTEPRKTAESFTITEQGERFSPTIRYVVIRSKTVPVSVRWSFILFSLTLPFETMDVGFAPNSLSVSRIAGLLFFGFYLLFCSPLFGKSPLPRPHPAVWWFLGYLAIYSMRALFTDPQFALSSDPQFAGEVLAYVVTFLQLVVLLWFTTELLKDQKMRESVLLAYSMGAVYLALGTILGLPGVTVQTGLDRRISAIGHNTNGLAGTLGLAVLILSVLRTKQVFKHILSKILFPVLTLPLLLVIVQTGSRSGILVLLSGSLVYLLPYWRSKRAVTVIILVTCGIGALLYLIATNPLMMERWQRAQGGDLAWRQLSIPAALGMISERPIFGWPRSACEIGARIGTKECLSAHNLPLDLLAEVGVVGSIPFFVGLWLCCRAAWMARRGDLGLMPLALLSAGLVFHMANAGHTWKTFWLVMAFTLATASTAAMKQTQYKRVFLVRALLKRDVLRGT